MKRLVLFLLLGLASNLAFAQTGSISGKITDENKLGLPGASVYIEALQLGTSTDVNGNYALVNVPSGSHQLTISFIGYTKLEQNVSVAEGQTTEISLSMEPGVNIGTEILILGDRLKGQAKAINQQRSNMNITNIVAADQIGRFPDANIGDALKRIPGITIQGDQGEARNFIVRGLAPQLNSVMINGDRIPSAEGDNRNIQLDLIPSDMIQTIEVNKALTPDMDADAIGGSVNLVTRSAPNGLRVSGTLASGFNFLSDKPIWTGTIIVGNRFLNNKLGVLVSANYNNHQFGSDNIEAQWTDEAESPLTEEDIEVDPYTESFEIRRYLIQRIRRSLSATLDYQINANNLITFRSIYNWRDDWENRFRLTYDDIEPIFEDETENIVGYEAVAVRQTKGGRGDDRVDNRRLEDQRVYNFSLRGDHLIASKIKLNWMTAFARASEERPGERYIGYVTDDSFELNTNFSDPEFPRISPADNGDVALSNFNELDELTEERGETFEKDINGRLDLEIPLKISNNQGFIKFGGRLRYKEKERNNNFFEYSPLDEDAFANLGLLSTSDQSDADFLAGGQYAAGDFVTPEFLGALDLNNPNLFEREEAFDEYLAANFRASETITGGYLMWNQNISNKFSFLAGLRIENTQIDYTGNNVLDEEELLGEVNRTDSYTNIMPGLHLRYAVNDDLIIRAAWTNTLARPNYYDLVPFRDQRDEDEELFIGNPNLDPTTSMNFDLGVDKYFESIGLVSGNFFYKNIDEFIYINQQEDYSDEFVDDYVLFEPLNGGTANLYGIELSFQRQLDFLPGIWKGLGVYLNYTYNHSEADGIRNEDGEEREGLALPGTAPHIFNASLSFETKKLVLRASLNYADSYLDEVGGDDFTDRYYDSQLFLDINGSYAFTPQLRFFFEVNNLTNQPLRYFQGIDARTMQSEYYNVRFNAGLKFDLFK
ncbi:MAG: TonB-dependent receptor [Microscillaceae bacterium]|nr:TonB-dependent receptor [Microscillaceae bacterium]